MTDALAPASQEHAPLVKHETDVGAFFYIENEVDEMKCRICGETEELTFPVKSGLCWWCIEDANEPEPYAGGMEPRSVFPLMDEFEAEWGVTDD